MILFRLTALFITFYALLLAPARADGVKFFHGSWAQAMAEARRLNKPIFIDVYTTWCGPCKLMAAQAFPNPRVAERMNTDFINYKIDAEKGEGEVIAKRYGVQAFPTSLFVSVEGRLIRRTVGYNGVDAFLAEARRALSDANASHAMAVWNKKFDEGERSAEFLRGMLLKQLEYDRPTGDVLDEYLKTLPQDKNDTLSNEQIEFLSKVLATSFTKAYLLLAQESSRIMDNPAKRHLVQNLTKAHYNAEQNDFKDAVATQDEPLLEALIKNITAKKQAAQPVGVPFTPEQKAHQDREADENRLRFYKSSRLPNHYMALARKIAETRLMPKTDAELDSLDQVINLRTGPMMAMVNNTSKDSSTLHVAQILSDSTHKISRVISKVTATQLRDLAEGLMSYSSDKNDLWQALRWSERSVQLDPVPLNLITQARLLTRLGRKVDARQCIRKGIDKQTKEIDKAQLQQELARLK